MKKVKKCALGLVAIVAGVTALSSCDRVTASEEGVIMTYTDATGARTSYTARDLLKDYQQSGSSLSSQFDKIFEVLVRKYYATYHETHEGDNGAKLHSLEATANTEVTKVKENATKNASSNGTSYETELAKLFASEGVKNIDELYQKKFYDAQKADFTEQMNQNFGTGNSKINGYEVMRDGKLPNGDEAFKASEDWGKGNEGWLKEQMPYHVRHILVKLASGSDKQYTQDKIGDNTGVGEYGEATRVANIVLNLAGAQIAENGLLAANSKRMSFGEIAGDSDDGSKDNYGEYGIMNKHTVGSDSALVHEFQLGTYAFETLYSKRGNASPDAYRLMPGLKQNAESAANVDDKQVLSDGTTVYDFFENQGVGQIPMGAALALLDTAKTTTDDNKTPVNSDSKETFYPRNVIYNKYFNKHNVCVITPNVIPTNATPKSNALTPSGDDDYRYSWLNNDSKTAATAALSSLNGLYNSVNGTVTMGTQTEEELSKGVYSKQFGALPGFSVDTTNIVSGVNDAETEAHAKNVLTDEEGNVVMVVRAGSGSSYQGIHFITVSRSALSEYGYKKDGDKYINNTKADVMNDKGEYIKNSPSLSDYYSVYVPSTTETKNTDYPTYLVDGTTSEPITSYVNFNKNSSTDFNERRTKITTAITSYLSDLNTYEFQRLFEEGKVTFTDEALAKSMKTFSQTKRQSTEDDLFSTWKNGWKEYAEMIEAQNETRAYGAGTLKGTLITELCAVAYGHANDSTSVYEKLFNVGGACYYAK